MKRTILITLILSLTVFSGKISAQSGQEEYLGLPGDNLNLYAVMKLFQESETLEGFERALNDEKTGINNLDLNGDDLVDYIMVTDYVDGNVHQIVLRVAINQQETQDVAVFTVERFSDGTVQVQLIGDEALYGKDYIVEPVYSDANSETPNPGYLGSYQNGRRVVVYRTNHYVIADWPIVHYMFYPGYIGWHSPWYWGCSFSWWSPWRSWSWHYYYGYHSHWYPHYYAHYRIVNRYRCANYHNYYYGNVRTWSPYVSHNIREGRYRSTYNHPEQRREGEARFASNYPDRVRDSRNLSGGSSARRSGSETIRREQRSAGENSNLDRSRSSSGQRNYSGTSSTGRRNEQLNRSESTSSRQRSVGTTPERNSVTSRNSATISGRNRSNGNSTISGRSSSSNRENPAVRRDASGSSYNSGTRSSQTTISRGERPSASRERISSSSNRSSSSGNSSGSGSLKSASRSTGKSSGSISSRSSGGQSKSSVSSRSSGGSGKSSVSSRSSGGGSRSGVGSGSSGGHSRSSGGSSGGSRGGGHSGSSRR